MQTVILGLGNELLGDEGVGIHAARQLIEHHLPDGVLVVEVGTAILDALPVLEEAERIIILDAIQWGGQPGSVYKVALDDCSGSSCIASMHGFDIFRLLALVDRDPPPAIVFGVEPEKIDWSMDVSPVVGESIPHLVQAVLSELELA